MSGGGVFKLLLVVVVVVALGLGTFSPLLGSLDLGLDLRGGVHVVLRGYHKNGDPVTDKDMVQLEAVMRQRVDELGVSEPIIQREGEDRLIIELAGVDDPEKAVEIIGTTAALEFKTFDGKTILSGDDLKTAEARLNTVENKPQVNLEFNATGAKIFADITTQLSRDYSREDPRRRIAIVLDGQVISNPTVDEPIPNGQARISGGFATFEEAANLAALLRAGALPVDVEIMAKQTVGPKLGADSLAKSKVAVTVGVIAIMLFMVAFYRVPGFIATMSLVIYGLILLGALSALKAVLTLPGIAGILLSVGMAVDANVIIYERIKEELRNGKTLRAAVDAGFSRAFWTIFDANVTTLIGAAVLFQFGTGPIRGFAVTLAVGILASMFTAITLTRFMLRTAVHVKALRSPKLYGV